MDIKRQQRCEGRKNEMASFAVAFNKVLNTIIALTHEFEDEWRFILHCGGQLITRVFLHQLWFAKRPKRMFIQRSKFLELDNYLNSANAWYIFTILCQLTCTNFSLSFLWNLFEVDFCSLETFYFSSNCKISIKISCGQTKWRESKSWAWIPLQ